MTPRRCETNGADDFTIAGGSMECMAHSGVVVEIRNLKHTCEEQWERINMIERNINKTLGVVAFQAFVFIGGLVMFILQMLKGG